MKISHAQQTLTELLAQTEKTSVKKIYTQLIAVLNDLREREFTPEQLNLIEEAIDPLLLPFRHVKELKSSHRRFIRFVSKTLSLHPAGHYTAVGLALGVGLGASVLPGIMGSSGSATGLSVGLGLIAGAAIGALLDLEATKRGRVLKTH